jgi:crotonobetainyl-CoA:carnitine CoA-transferase CaiB-like acyl-CoA transferase
MHSLVRIESLPRHGVSTFSRAFFRAYETADGYVTVAAYAERMARAFCAAIGLEGLLERPPWDDRATRSARADELVALFAPRMLLRPTAEWDRLLAGAGVPAAPVGERDDLFDDEQVRAMGLLEEIQDPEVGAMLMTAPAVRLSGTPGAIRFTGRHLGADTEAVLAELGRSPDEIAALIAGGAAERFSG